MDTVRATCRRGVTMIEVLVVIGVIGVLLAILAPAVQAVRGRARFMQCQSNLKQLVIASQLYHDAWGVFPVHARPYVKMLPYLDQRPLYESVVAAIDNQQPVVVPPLEVLRCPSDADGRELPLANFLICDNAGHQAFPFSGMRKVPGAQSSTSHADFTDGTSQTVYYSEKLVSIRLPVSGANVTPTDSWERRMRVGWYTTAGLTDRNELDAFADTCADNPQYSPPMPPISDSHWLDAYDGYNHILPPNNFSCWNGPSPQGYQLGAYLGAITATSLHTGGANSVFVDGHVRFISSSINRAVWRAMATRAGGDHAAE